MSYARIASRTTILLIGCPNSGKTTLYNWITGLRHKTVNYPGSTVDYSVGESLDVYGEAVQVIDTPGTYSLLPEGVDEEVTVGVVQNLAAQGNYHIVLVIDATQLDKNFLLFMQLREMNLPFSVALTMEDIVRSEGKSINVEFLTTAFLTDVVPIDGRLGSGVAEIVQKVRAQAHNTQPRNIQILKECKSCDDLMARRQWKELTSEAFPIDKKSPVHKKNYSEQTRKWDRVLLHPVVGLIIFVLLMFVVFSSIFWMAAPFMDAIDASFAGLGSLVVEYLGENIFSDLIAKGILAGTGSVLVFVPQIAILFVALTLLEDSGYLARAATLIDRPMQALGLSGRSFLPLLSGYACAIPAMMAARAVGGRKERWLTLFIIPLMSCSARLPVYALLLALLFPGDAMKAGLILTVIYFVSLFVGALAAMIMSRLVKIKGVSLFMLELPVYRRPSARKVLITTFDKTKSYILRAGPTIFFLSLVIWFFTTFPRYEIRDEFARMENSFAAQLGHIVEPILEPMGGDWRVGVSLLSAFAAREVFVSSMAIVFHLTNEKGEAVSQSLLSALTDATRVDGTRLFTPGSIFALILFFMIALQCMSTVAVARQEFGSWKWPLVQLITFNVVAYILATSVYQIWTRF